MESISIKQEYLRDNILEKGYDAEEFMKYLQFKKGDSGLDLNNWTMIELMSAVDEYIGEKSVIEEIEEENEEETEDLNSKEKGNKKKNENEKKNQNISEQDKIPDLENIDTGELNLRKTIIKDKSEYGLCKSPEVTEISKSNEIKVKLSLPEKIEGSFFQKSFVSYMVQTEPLGYQTRKRYSDFVFLRKALSLLYPNCVIPPLCKKNYGDRFSDTLISKRTRSIEKFMEGIMMNPVLRNDKFLFEFLTHQNPDFYKNNKNRFKSITSPNYVKDIINLNGEVKISIDKEKEKYFDNIKDISSIKEELFQKVTKTYKSIMNSLEQAGKKMKELSEIFKTIYDTSTKFNDSPNISAVYEGIFKIMSDWSEVHKKQINIINFNVREYFRYVKNEFHSFKEMFSMVDHSKLLYTKSLEKLLQNKEKLFKQQDVSLWDLEEKDLENKSNLLNNKDLAFAKMLPNLTRRVEEYKYFYGCLLNSIISEYERIEEVNSERHKNNITNFINQLSEVLMDFHVSLADILFDFKELKTDLNRKSSLFSNILNENEKKKNDSDKTEEKNKEKNIEKKDSQKEFNAILPEKEKV